MNFQKGTNIINHHHHQLSVNVILMLLDRNTLHFEVSILYVQNEQRPALEKQICVYRIGL